MQDDNILVRDIGNVGKWITIRTQARARLVPDDFSFWDETMQSGTAGEIDMREYILAVLVGIARSRGHPFLGVRHPHPLYRFEVPRFDVRE